MAESEKVIIEIVLDDGSVQKGFAKIKGVARSAGKDVDSSLGGSITSLTSKFGVLGKVITAVLAGAFASAAAISAAVKQEEVISQVTNALALAGDEATTTLKRFEEYAQGIQDTTKFSKETVLQQVVLARALTNSADQAKKLVDAAISLSAGTGGAIALDSAVKKLGQTLQGSAGSIAKLVPGLKNLTKEQLKSGAAIDLASKRFSGSATAALLTFGGSVTQAKNSLGGFLTNIGLLVTRNPAVINSVNFAAKSFEKLAKGVEAAFPDVFKTQLERNRLRIRELTEVIETFNDKLKKNQADASDPNVIISGAAINAVETAKKKIDELTAKRDLFIADNKRLAKKEAPIVPTEKLDPNSFFSSLGNIEGQGQLLALDQSIRNQQDLLARGREENLINQEQFDSLSLALLEQTEEKRLQILAASGDRSSEILLSSQKAIKNGFVAGISNSFSALGAALQKGENAFSAFGNAILGVLGDILIQIGTSIVTAGKTIDALAKSIASGFGGFAIVGGLALIAAGGFLKSLAGSAGGGVAAAAGGGGGGVATTETDAFNEEADNNGPNQSVVINVEGTVIDPKTTGQQIADVLEEFFDSTGSRIVSVG